MGPVFNSRVVVDWYHHRVEVPERIVNQLNVTVDYIAINGWVINTSRSIYHGYKTEEVIIAHSEVRFQ
jgi:hypothetical protein